MICALIAAMDLNRGIGFRGTVPWRLPSDLKRFKELTMGHHLIMGRKTYDSIGKPLPGRISIVVSRSPKALPPGAFWAPSLPAALDAARQAGESEVFIIGGGEIYAQAMALAQRLYLTIVQATFQCDVWFPHFSEADWVEVHREAIPAGERDPLPSIFRILERSGWRDEDIPSP